MYQESDVSIELPIAYVREHCTAWAQLCKELDLEANGLERAIYLPSDRVSLDLAQAKRYGLCQEWWL